MWRMPSPADMGVLERVRHANILPFVSCWENAHNVVFITDLMRGGNVRDFLKRTGHPRLHVLQAWCRQLLGALSYLHTRRPRIVHRDINCANIFVDNRLVKLGNLAMAQVMHTGTAAGVVGGWCGVVWCGCRALGGPLFFPS